MPMYVNKMYLTIEVNYAYAFTLCTFSDVAKQIRGMTEFGCSARSVVDSGSLPLTDVVVSGWATPTANTSSPAGQVI